MAYSQLAGHGVQLCITWRTQMHRSIRIAVKVSFCKRTANMKFLNHSLVLAMGLLQVAALAAYGQAPALSPPRVATLQLEFCAAAVPPGLILTGANHLWRHYGLTGQGRAEDPGRPKHAHMLLSAKLYIGALILFPLVIFLAMGYSWQALDEEEFPDRDLPHWFVWLFRGRHSTAPPHST